MPRITDAHRSATRRSTSVLSQLGRPEDGTDPTLHQQPRDLRQAQAARRSGRRRCTTLDDVVDAHERRTSTRSPASSTTSRSRSATTWTRTSPASSARSRVKIYGDDLEALQDARRAAPRRRSPRSPGVADLGIVKSSEIPQLAGRARPRRARRATASTSATSRTYIETALGGQPVGEFWDGERALRRRRCACPPRARDDVEKIRKLRVAGEGRRHRAARDARRRRHRAAAARRSAARTASATSASA